LQAAWQAAAQGGPGLIAVGGEAGVGKTRLVSELSRVASGSGGRVLVGAGADFGAGGLPMGPIIEALRPLAASLAQLSQMLGAALPELARLLPELATDDARPAPAWSDEFARARLFEVLLALLDRLSRDRPTLLVLEDLHWADSSTLDLLAFLARNVRDERLLVVGTYRSDEVHWRHPLRRYLSELERSGRIQRVDLAPFGAREVRSQLEAILGRDPGPELTEHLFGRSEGNPFFVEELLGASQRIDGDDALPPTLHAILAARFEALSEGAQRIVRVAAVAGRRFDEGLLAAVAGVAEEQLVDALREAVAQQILVPEPDAPGQRYVFRHALLQEAIYANLLPGERTRLHRSVAEALAKRRTPGGPSDAEVAPQLAHHWYHAHDLGRALQASVEAGVQANRIFAFREALTHLERAVELWPAVPDPTGLAGMDRVALLAQAARASRGAGQSTRSAALLRAAIAEADARKDPGRVGRLHGELMLSLVQTGDSRGADAAIDAALRLTSLEPRTSQRAHVLMLAGVQLALASRHRDALPLLREAREIAIAADALDEEVPSPSRMSTRLGSRVAIALCTGYLGDVEEAVRLLIEERRLATQGDRSSRLADSFGVQAIILEAAGRFEEAIAVVEEAIGEMRPLALDRSLATTLEMTAGEALRHLGRWTEAERISRDVIRNVVRHAAAGWDIGGAHAARALLLVGIGRMAEAEEELALAQRAFPPGAEGRGVGLSGLYFSARAEAALYRSEPVRAREHVAGGLRGVEPSGDIRWIGHLSTVGLRAEADFTETARSRKDQAQVELARGLGARLVEQLGAAARRSIDEGTIFHREVRGYLALGEAEFARLSGASDPALWAAAAGTWEELREPYPVAYALYRQAEATLRSSRSREAPTQLLRKAREITRTLGAEPLRREIESLAKRARLNVTSEGALVRPTDVVADGSPLDAYRLTPREREVLAMLAAGKSDREIAEALYISGKTASVHVSNIKGKLGVNHRVEAATLAIRLGVTSDVDGTPR
jgi:DNA-binding CsgD family transcriptional regulator/tetratricopeptide (TPR) repeat protein